MPFLLVYDYLPIEDPGIILKLIECCVFVSEARNNDNRSSCCPCSGLSAERWVRVQVPVLQWSVIGASKH